MKLPSKLLLTTLVLPGLAAAMTALAADHAQPQLRLVHNDPSGKGKTRTPPKPSRHPAHLGASDIAALRPQLAALFSLPAASIPSPTPSTALNLPGATVNVGFGNSAAGGVWATNASLMMDDGTPSSVASIQAPGPNARIGITAANTPGGTYLITCYVSTANRTLAYSIEEQNGSLWDIPTPVVDGERVILAYESSPNPGQITVNLQFDGSASAGDVLAVHSCDFMRVK